jgi:predicted nucleotidyltransferase
VTGATEPMTNSDTDPALRDLTLAAARSSDASAELLAGGVALGHSVWAARTAGHTIGGIGRALVQGRGKARHRRAQNRIRPSVRLAEHSAEVMAAATACGLTDVRVFGSCARGTDTRASDVDLIVGTTGPRTSLFDVTRFALAVEDLLTLEEGEEVCLPTTPSGRAPTAALASPPSASRWLPGRPVVRGTTRRSRPQ